MDTIFIENLRVDTVIGVCDWEKQVEQTLYFDVQMKADIQAAAAADDLAKTVDYAAVAEHIGAFTRAQRGLLIETLLENLVTELLAAFPLIAEIRLVLRKPQALGNADFTGLSITRSRHS